MIAPMRQVTVICLKADQAATLAALRDLEVLHVAGLGAADSRDYAAAVREKERCDRVIVGLGEAARGAGPDDPPPPADVAALTLDALCQEAEQRLAETVKAHEEVEHWHRVVETLRPWGQFDRAQLQRLRQSGLHLFLGSAAVGHLPPVPPGAVYQEISRDKGTLHFVVASAEPIALGDLREVVLPDATLAEAHERLAAARQHLAAVQLRLRHLAGRRAELARLSSQRLEAVEFLAVRDGMADADAFACVGGYCLAAQVERLRAAAQQHGWGLLVQEPAADDKRVPTHLELPSWLRLAMPLYEFVGIRPGYREFDISVWFLTFFSIFFAIIVGDGGYGAIVVAGALWAKRKAPQKAQVPLNLVLLLGINTIIWGLLSGTFFAIPTERLPVFMRGLAWLDADHVLRNLPFLCFLLAAIHLSLAHLWKILVAPNSLASLSQVGWIVAIWANFMMGRILWPSGTSAPTRSLPYT